MIQKIIKLKSIGTFRNCSATGNVDFAKETLFYGGNGKGKTTLCDVFRSLNTGDPARLLGRKTLGATDKPEALLRINNKNVEFKNGAWSEVVPEFLIFDTVFVHENVYAGDVVGHDHKKNLYGVIVGEQGVKLARKVEELDGNIRDANRDVGAKKATAEAAVPKGIVLTEFLKIQKDSDINGRIAAKQAEISALKRSSEIANKPLLSSIALPDFPPANFSSILSKKMQEVAQDAEKLVRQHLADHTNKATESWLLQGTLYKKENRCPLCGQDVAASDLFAAYTGFFERGYSDVKLEVRSLDTSVRATFSEKVISGLESKMAGNDALVEFWTQFVKVEKPQIDFEWVRGRFELLQKLSVDYIARKIEAPLEPIDLGNDFSEALKEYDTARSMLASYNDSVAVINASITAFKAKTTTGDLTKLQKDLIGLEIVKLRNSSNIEELYADYAKAEQAKRELDSKKDEAKTKLDQYSNAIFEKYQKQINIYLGMFGAAFKLSEAKRSYVGGKPSSSYQLIINNSPFDLGDGQTPVSTPSFRNTLSGGDRSALALAFFIAQIENDPHLANKILVFDDPFTSQDRFRRSCTQQLIQKFCAKAKQGIIFSHDPSFLKLITDHVPDGCVKTLQIVHCNNTATINEWNLDAELQSDYLKNYASLNAFLQNGTGNLRDIARCIRPILEANLRVRYPGHFAPDEWLGNFLQKIRTCDSANSLFPLQAHLPEFDAINDYSKKHHHDTNPTGWETEMIDDVELKGFVKRTLSLLGGA